jgi:hypothetical protein
MSRRTAIRAGAAICFWIWTSAGLVSASRERLAQVAML